jgi:hypothetical protein
MLRPPRRHSGRKRQQLAPRKAEGNGNNSHPAARASAPMNSRLARPAPPHRRLTILLPNGGVERARYEVLGNTRFTRENASQRRPPGHPTPRMAFPFEIRTPSSPSPLPSPRRRTSRRHSRHPGAVATAGPSSGPAMFPLSCRAEGNGNNVVRHAAAAAAPRDSPPFRLGHPYPVAEGRRIARKCRRSRIQSGLTPPADIISRALAAPACAHCRCAAGRAEQVCVHLLCHG